jgi:preprotein translocase subunit SecF
MINFLKYRWLYAIVSLTILIPGVYALIRWGLNPSIDFVGGTVVKLESNSVTTDDIKKSLAEQQVEYERVVKDNNTIVIRTKPIDRETWKKVEESLIGSSSANIQEKESTVSASKTLTVLQFESVGPVLGKELLTKTLVAAFIAIVCILLYVAWAFKNIVFGISAVLALIHDLLVVLGIFSLLGHFAGVEVDVLFVTALLTTMSFSVHDTIVVFDRIRETMKTENYPLEVTINKSLSETMVRSVNNSMTIIMMLLALLLLGGETIRYFVLALLIGTISGTYSSPFVATPILYELLRRKNKKRN